MGAVKTADGKGDEDSGFNRLVVHYFRLTGAGLRYLVMRLERVAQRYLEGREHFGKVGLVI
jgi:hypothetical protein